MCSEATIFLPWNLVALAPWVTWRLLGHSMAQVPDVTGYLSKCSY